MPLRSISKRTAALAICAGFLAIPACGGDSTPSPSEPQTQRATVTGTLSLPASAAGKQFGVLIDTDIDADNGYVAIYEGTCGSGTSVSYTLQNVAAGQYYIYAAVGAASDLDDGPVGGDFLGIYGTNSAFPSQPNAVVPSTGTATFNISMVRWLEGDWEYSFSNLSATAGGVTLVCSGPSGTLSIEHEELREFSGDYWIQSLLCSGGGQTTQDGPFQGDIVSGSAGGTSIAFDFDDSNWRHTGSINAGQMNGQLAVRLDVNGTPVTMLGNWTATSEGASGIVASRSMTTQPAASILGSLKRMGKKLSRR